MLCRMRSSEIARGLRRMTRPATPRPLRQGVRRQKLLSPAERNVTIDVMRLHLHRPFSAARRAAAPLVLLLALAAPPPLAAAVVVPGDFATVQAALDSHPDSVIVKPGVAPERVTITRPVALVAWTQDLPSGDAVPRLDALTVLGPDVSAGEISVRGFHVQGPVQLRPAGVHAPPAYFPVRFEACRMDSGLSQSYGGDNALVLRLRGCTIFGPVEVRCVSLDFSLNTLIGGGLIGNLQGGGIAQSNLILGPAPVAIDLDLASRWNTIRGVQDGIVVHANQTAVVEGDLLEDCSGTAIVSRSVNGGGQIVGNRVRRGGAGLDVTSFRGPQTISGNDVRDVGGIGIRVASDRNTVTLGAANVVAGCGGAGFDVRARGVLVAGNTSALNHGPGFVIESAASVDHDIAFANDAHGLEWLGPDAAPLSCNDWFGNGGSAVSGGAPSAADLAQDPEFCDGAHGDFHLSTGSPVLDPAGCGRMGALGAGCSDAPTATLFSEFEAVASEEGIVVRWRVHDSGAVRGVLLERAPAAAGPWREIGAGAPSGDGAFQAEDRDVREGASYFYRLRAFGPGGDEVFFGPRMGVAGVVESLRLDPVSPNPARGAFTLAYALPRDERVRVTVHDVQGREVAILLDGAARRGWYRLSWNGRAASGTLPSGVYFVRLASASTSLSRAITLTR